MNSRESEYRQLFLAEANENFEELNKLFIALEQNHSDTKSVQAIFRITHTLKGNAMGMGLNDIAALGHVLEDVMGAVINGQVPLDKELFDNLFKANDKLGLLIGAVDSGEKVSYLGIKTKLTVFLKNALTADEEGAAPVPAAPEMKTEEFSETPSASKEGAGNTDIKFNDVIQIPVKKLDDMMNMVGQLMIERDRLVSLYSDNGRRSEFEGLKRISSNLQYAIMNTRMVQVGFLFDKFHRIVRDVSKIENKEVKLELKGTEIEIDRNVLKVISDALIHLVRNAVSHGIEKHGQRSTTAKNPTGRITLNSRSEKGNVVIEVIDDGAGIDKEVIRKKVIEKGMLTEEDSMKMSEGQIISYIFEPGFSNAEKVTEISGRGVGMDVVKKAVESIGGQVLVKTELGQGTTISLLLPSSMALKGALLFLLNDQEYAVPLSYTDSVITLKKGDIHKIGGGLMCNYHKETISVVFLKDILFGDYEIGAISEDFFHASFDEIEAGLNLDIIVVKYMERNFGFVVDKLLYQKEIIEKTLNKPLEKTRLLSGTTILGNGKVCPVIDIPGVTDSLIQMNKKF